tara:strand:- start:3922 stop:4203 length:282 start_codon:yes stop_codon:yes gene_type:complete
MKSAYELAMERLEKEAPVKALTEEQKEEISKVENRFKAKIAEKEVFLQGLIEQAEAQQNLEELLALKQQLASEVNRINADMEEAKEKIRKRES